LTPPEARWKTVAMIASEILDYYGAGKEEDWLKTSVGRLELIQFNPAALRSLLRPPAAGSLPELLDCSCGSSHVTTGQDFSDVLECSSTYSPSTRCSGPASVSVK
jgi:hypothetical protein